MCHFFYQSTPSSWLAEAGIFCSVLVDISLTEDRLSLSTEQRNKVLEAWNAVEEHDKQPQQFNQLYRTHWGNTLHCRTKRDDLVEAAVTQRIKMAKRYAPAQHDIQNGLRYTLVKLLCLRSPRGSRTSPEKKNVVKAYERIQHWILIDDPVLAKAGIPLPKINTKTVRDFIRQQERLLNLRATTQPSTVGKTSSISSADLPPAPLQRAVLPPPDCPLMEYVPTPSTAGTRVLKGRVDSAASSSLEVDVGYDSDGERDDLTPLRKNLRLTEDVVAPELNPCVENVCGPNHLPGYQHVEELSRVLVDIALEEEMLAPSQWFSNGGT